MPPVKYDYASAEKAFVSAPDDERRVTLKVVAEQFGIPHQTIRRYAAQHAWTRKRLDAIIPGRLRSSLERTNNPYVRASILRSLERYENGSYATNVDKS